MWGKRENSQSLDRRTRKLGLFSPCETDVCKESLTDHVFQHFALLSEYKMQSIWNNFDKLYFCVELSTAWSLNLACFLGTQSTVAKIKLLSLFTSLWMLPVSFPNEPSTRFRILILVIVFGNSICWDATNKLNLDGNARRFPSVNIYCN